ncbi:MAG: hypothetical protein Ct9H300mP25_11560 [Acidobacteriota bacterium]|nr:MAG: hypothetical protein Ct9H300mP25_11560 [Acidobacteriota bacterium]
MAVELTVLGSGSAGNATLLSYADTNVLIKLGLVVAKCPAIGKKGRESGVH